MVRLIATVTEFSILIVVLFWKMIELNKVFKMRIISTLTLAHFTIFQKFRAYLLDSDKAADVLAYLLCYGLDIKDKPRKSLRRLSSHRTRVHCTV